MTYADIHIYKYVHIYTGFQNEFIIAYFLLAVQHKKIENELLKMFWNCDEVE